MNNLPTIRAGQRKPYVKATREQIDERIGYVARLLRAGRTKTQIHRTVRARFNIEWRQCDRYIALLTRDDATFKTTAEPSGAHGLRTRPRVDPGGSP